MLSGDVLAHSSGSGALESGLGDVLSFREPFNELDMECSEPVARTCVSPNSVDESWCGFAGKLVTTLPSFIFSTCSQFSTPTIFVSQKIGRAHV